MVDYRGFIVAAWAEGGRVFLSGRLEGGESFAVVAKAGGASVFAPRAAAAAFEAALAPLEARRDPEAWEDMAGAPLARFVLPPGPPSAAERALRAAGLAPAALERGGAEDFLLARGISGEVLIRGEPRPGRRADLVFLEPELRPSSGAEEGAGPRLGEPVEPRRGEPVEPRRGEPVEPRRGEPVEPRWAAIDIETDREGRVVAASVAAEGRSAMLFLGPATGDPGIASFPDEAGLLAGLRDALVDIDPDVVTGWNVLDFDLRAILGRCASLGMEFSAGRAEGPPRVLERPGRGLLVELPGRATIDAMRLLRASGERYEDQSLETVARAVLGEGKTVSVSGEAKLDELDRLRREDPVAFCRYCLRDAELVLRILEATGLGRLTARRAALTGLPLDLAWTSIPAFERVYAAALRERRVLPPPRGEEREVGAAGGTVLEARAGFFEGVMVFDFRSLYPSVMRTFNVDPLAHARASARPAADDIEAPNGARFARAEGPLRAVIARYAAEREAALAAGDEVAAYVYKILQNSFYGVLGAEGCRYGRAELAGTITSFGRKFLLLARDWFEARGFRVLYGDTDSVFVESGFAAAEREAAAAWGAAAAAGLNAEIAHRVRGEYGLESFLRIRAERFYARFFIPRLRMERSVETGARRALDRPPAEEAEGGAEGRAKGYAGLVVEESGARVEVKGMEAARSDWTPLARRFQVELLGLVFGRESGGREPGGAAEAAAYCAELARRLREGGLDEELVYKKYLRRPARDYASETPQVRAARLLGWEGRRGSIRYLMTKAGAEPLELRSGSPIDYDHYVERQLLPIAKAVADARALAGQGPSVQGGAAPAGGAVWDAEAWFADRPQLELGF